MRTLLQWSWALPLLATGVAMAGALVGISVAGARTRARVAVPVSGALLLAVAVFGLLPESGQEIGWIPGLFLFAVGYYLLFAIDRWGVPVCPSCSPEHDHDHCETELHGFTIPLIAAAALHTFIDGWGLASVESAGAASVRIAFPMAVLLHKAPEGLALGAMLESSTGSKRRAFMWVAGVELMTLAGSAAGFEMAAGAWMQYLLAATGGSFVFLGGHAVHGEWKRQKRHAKAQRSQRKSVIPGTISE